MTLKTLLSSLETLLKIHPEAGDAEVWAKYEKSSMHVKYIGLDKRHKPSRVTLSE